MKLMKINKYLSFHLLKAYLLLSTIYSTILLDNP